MASVKPIRIKSITEAYRLAGLSKPHHPLISIIDCAELTRNSDVNAVVCDFYTITLKRGCNNLIYGQQSYDFDEGVMGFWAPNQVLRGDNSGADLKIEGWMMLVHPDFLWHTPLARKIKQYDFFGYSANEALFLSDREEMVINGIVENIRQEYHSNIDKFSQDVIIAQLELLLTYAQRFYERQFITRKIANNKVLNRLEEILDDYFKKKDLISTGLPTVQYVADLLNMSPKYLSSLLKQLTGQTTQQHIHSKLIEKAKEKLSTIELSVSEIAYELGFEHSQSFSKLFKIKTSQSPLDFRASFN